MIEIIRLEPFTQYPKWNLSVALTLRASHFDLSPVVRRLRRNSLITPYPGDSRGFVWPIRLLTFSEGRAAERGEFVSSSSRTYASSRDDIAYQRWE